MNAFKAAMAMVKYEDFRGLVRTQARQNFLTI